MQQVQEDMEGAAITGAAAAGVIRETTETAA